MNQTIDNDLQKAIDDITKTTAGDPIFADSVATPEEPAPMPPAPGTPITPEFTGNVPMPPHRKVTDPMVNPTSNPAPTFTAPTGVTAPVMPAPVNTPTPAGVPTPAPTTTKESIIPTGSNKIEEEIVTVAPFVDEKEGSLSVKQVKEAALRGLAPILSKLDVPAEQKFDIYKNVIDNYHDSSVLEPAYRAASEISDDKERGEALLYLVDSIDDMNS